MLKITTQLITLIAFLTSTQMAWAKDPLLSSFDMLQTEAYSRYSAGNEYISGQEAGTVMMKVNLWGAVKRPGIHHVPVKSSLIELMSYAGGPSDNALLDEITIKRNLGQEQKKISINLAEILHDQKQYDLVLKPDDIIVVPASQPWISQNMFTAAMILSIIASTALSIQIMQDRN
jgi:hypothetical protein